MMSGCFQPSDEQFGTVCLYEGNAFVQVLLIDSAGIPGLTSYG